MMVSTPTVSEPVEEPEDESADADDKPTRTRGLRRGRAIAAPLLAAPVEPLPPVYQPLPAEVKERAHRGEKDGRISFWLQPTAYDQACFKEQWERIGHGQSPEA